MCCSIKTTEHCWKCAHATGLLHFWWTHVWLTLNNQGSFFAWATTPTVSSASPVQLSRKWVHVSLNMKQTLQMRLHVSPHYFSLTYSHSQHSSSATLLGIATWQRAWHFCLELSAGRRKVTQPSPSADRGGDVHLLGHCMWFKWSCQSLFTFQLFFFCTTVCASHLVYTWNYACECVCPCACVCQRDSLPTPDGHAVPPHQPWPVTPVKVTSTDTKGAICTIRMRLWESFDFIFPTTVVNIFPIRTFPILTTARKPIQASFLQSVPPLRH